MSTLLLFSLLLLAPFTTPSPPSAPASAANATATCPLDLTFASTFPWDETSCLHATSNLTDCCTTLRGLLGIAFAERLHKSGSFRLPDAPTAAACLADLAAEISTPPLSLNNSLVSACFPDPEIFVITKDFCAGILTKSEWDAKVGNDSALDAACGGDLTVTSTCFSCFSSGTDVNTQLTKIDGNISHSPNCFYLMAVYVAGVVNRYGPYDPRNVGCTFGLAIDWDRVRARSSSSKSHSAAIYASVAAAAAAVLAICAVGLFIWRHNAKKKKQRKASRRSESEILALERSLKSPHPRPHTGSIWFELKELEKATDYFSQRNLVGRGGFGVVFKGTLADGTVVAVKRMLQPDMEGSEEEFRNEVEIISHLRHRNLVPLRGCCIADDDEEEGRQRYLVYDYMPNGSLDDHIFSSGDEGSSSNNGGSVRKRTPLTWPQRKNIILDVAKGLAYLHYGVKPAIYHRDIKSTNILLDAEMRARVADFGLARQSSEGQTHMTTRVAGTHGYLAPEYALYGQLTEKSDVYSFGVLLLETMSGRRALDMSGPSNMVLITDWAWTQVKAGRGEEVFDEALLRGGAGEANANPKAIMMRYVMVGILCSHVMVTLRPTISDALKMLDGDIDVLEIPDRPLPLAHGSIYGDGRTFAASPMVSGPSLDTGDMLRISRLPYNRIGQKK